MADKQLGVRVSEKIASKLDVIVEKINKEVPEANISVSAILRFAITEYVKKSEEENVLYLRIPSEDLSQEHLEEVSKIVKNLNSIVKDDSLDKAVEKIEKRILDKEIASLIAKRKALKGGEK
jgi:NH3-dependent NAD+ synthetase